MKRRSFIKGLSAGSLLATTTLYSNHAMGCALFSRKKETTEGTKTITILHTNDTHSHIEPIASGRNAGRGGVARRKAIIERIRTENPNTLLLDCGDIFQGTPYFNFYGGELEIKLMSMLEYDAATLGNHDFDNGIEGLYKQLPHADFEFVISNYDFKNTVMEGKAKPHQIFERDGIRIGTFGLGIELQGLVDPRLYKETAYLDPLTIAQDQSNYLKNEQECDLVICMSHLGYQYADDKIDDLKIAAATENIDLIIGGHTHTFLDRPVKVNNKVGRPVIVNQVGCYGINLGRIDFHFNELDSSKIEANSSSHVTYEL